MFTVIYHYGLRVTEATLIQLDDVDFEQRRNYIPRVKRSVSGEKPLLQNTREAIQDYLPVRLWTGSTLFTGRQGNLKRQRIQQLFRRYAGQANLPSNFTVHCLRHSIATHLLEAGFGIEFVKDHLGHVNIQNTLIYTKLTSRRVEQIYRKMGQSAKIVKV